MSLDSILRATGKNLANCGEKSDWYSPISVLTKLTVSDGVVSLPAVSAGSGMAINKNRVFTNGETFTIDANHTSPTGDIPANQYRYILKPYKNNTVVKDITITGWTYNQYYNAYWASGTSKSFTLPKDTVNSFEWGLGFLAYGDISAGTVITYSNIQIEKGSTATTYEPYEYLGPKTINLGSGSSGKEVLKVSYNSRNLLPYPWTTTTKTKHGITFTDNGDGSLTISGTATAETYFILQSGRDYGNQPINAIATESATNGKYAVSKRLYYNNNSKVISVNILNGATINETIYPQIELGNKATDYVPYFNTVVWEKQEIVATNKLGSFKLGESVLA